jgi:hypothetical protein
VKSERFELRVSPEWLAALDGLRGEAESRAAVVVRLVESAAGAGPSVPAEDRVAARRATAGLPPLPKHASAPVVQRGSPSPSLRRFGG